MDSVTSQLQTGLVIRDGQPTSHSFLSHWQMDGWTLEHEHQTPHITVLLFTDDINFRVRKIYHGQALTTNGQPTPMAIMQEIPTPGRFLAFRPGKNKLKYVCDQRTVVIRCNN